MVYEERLRVTLFFSLKRRRLSGDLTAVFNYLMEGYREGTARLFLKIYSKK